MKTQQNAQNLKKTCNGSTEIQACLYYDTAMDEKNSKGKGLRLTHSHMRVCKRVIPAETVWSQSGQFPRPTYWALMPHGASEVNHILFTFCSSVIKATVLQKQIFPLRV